MAWIRRFVRFHGTRHPRELGTPEIRAFLSSLAIEANVAASTQNQAFAARLFLYRHVLKRRLADIGGIERARKPHRLPVVLTREEARSVLAELHGTPAIVAQLLYGSGLRLLEALRLRVKDIEFGLHAVHLRYGKGGKDRSSASTHARERCAATTSPLP